MFLSQKGMSLLEVLLALSLLGVSSIAMMKLQENMNRGQVTTETKMGEIEIRRVISTTLLDKEACSKTFQGFNIGANVPAIKNPAGTNIFEVNKSYENNTVKILNIKTEDKNAPNSNGTRSVDLLISLEKVKSKSYSSPKLIRVPLNVVATGPAAPIVDCFSDTDQMIDAAMEETCLSLEAVWDDTAKKCHFEKFRVYKENGGVTSENFMVTETGNVGMGTPDPISPLEVVFDNRVAGLSNDVVISRYENTNDWSPITFRRFRGTRTAPLPVQNGDWLGGILDHVRLSSGETATTFIQSVYLGNGTTNLSAMHFGTSNSARMTIDEVGQVGIGTSPATKLDVAGSIRPGSASEGASCSPLGAQAYQSTTGAPLYCSNAGIWTAVGGAGGWPSGSYCILRAGGNCPTGFTVRSGYLVALHMYAANSSYIKQANFGDSQIRCHGYCGQYGQWVGELHIVACCK